MSDKSQRDLIKLHIPGESFWAERLTKTTARIANILLDEVYGLHDIVKFDKDYNVIGVLEKKTFTAAIKYSPVTKETAQQVYDHFERNGFEMEGAVPGVAMIAVPMETSDEKLQQVIKSCKASVSLYTTENE